jgi:uncharacterized membrane protein (UPF0136 family)
MGSHASLTMLWIYIALLIAGGLMGYIRAKSAISLVSSVIFGAALALCALGVIRPFYVADVLVGLLLLIFGVRFIKGKKFMPSGLMLALSIVMLVALLFVH